MYVKFQSILYPYFTDCQLVSLSKDHTLRIWLIEEQIQQDLEVDMPVETSYVQVESLRDRSGLTLAPLNPGLEAETSFGVVTTPSSSFEGSPHNTPNTSIPISKPGSTILIPPNTPAPTPSNNSMFFSPSPSHTLAQEFALLNLDMLNLEMERVSL